MARLVAPVKSDRCEPELRSQLMASGKVPSNLAMQIPTTDYCFSRGKKSLGLAADDSNP